MGASVGTDGSYTKSRLGKAGYKLRGYDAVWRATVLYHLLHIDSFHIVSREPQACVPTMSSSRASQLSVSQTGSRPSSAASRKSGDLPDRLEEDRNELLDELIPWITSKSHEKKVQDLETVVNLVAKRKETSTFEAAGVRTLSVFYKRCVDQITQPVLVLTP